MTTTISIALLSIVMLINTYFCCSLPRLAKSSGEEMAQNLLTRTPIAIGKGMKILSNVQSANFILSVCVFASLSFEGIYYLAGAFVAIIWIGNAIYQKEFLDIAEKACDEALEEARA
jgi:hypothetical protein